MTKKAKTPKRAAATQGDISKKLINAMEADFSANPVNQIMQNAVTSVSVNKLASRREVIEQSDHSFSIKIDDWGVTNQKRSGRCWMFAGLNMLRPYAMKKMGLKNFEFSQNYTLYWDKLERANYFLEAMIKTLPSDVDDRTVNFLLKDPISDGGQWNMLVNIIKKYGLVPKAAMPETESSSCTGPMNTILKAKLRRCACVFRELQESGTSMANVRKAKEEMLVDIHRILRIHLGNPPKTFCWQWRDKDDKFHRNQKMTPKKFAQKYVGAVLDDYVCLVHDPRNPTGTTYTVEYLGNVIEGGIVKYLNIEVELMKDITRRTLEAGEAVWMGCDVGKDMHGESGLWEAGLNDFESIYGTELSLDKADRLRYAAACMTHAMLFTGVDICDDKPRRWRVENSWGDAKGQKGFYLMNDSWFDEHMFEIAAHKKYLPAALKKALDRKPTVLPAWDPMGSLAF